MILVREPVVRVSRLCLLGSSAWLTAHLLSMPGWPVLQLDVLITGLPAERMS